MLKYFFTLFFICPFIQAEELPLWEFGVGIGWVQFPQYPASEQYSSRILPFPTFQYRGEFLRADDREGTKAYLIKNQLWTLDFSAGGYPAADADDNRAREGMKDLPWMLFLGPQLILKLSEKFELRTSVFQSVSTNFDYTALSGLVFESKINFLFTDEDDPAGKSQITFEYRTAERKFLSTYFDVASNFATSSRPAYESKSGTLSYELSYFQSYRQGKWTYYFAAAYTDYNHSANKESPLHKVNATTSLLVALAYQLGRSNY